MRRRFRTIDDEVNSMRRTGAPEEQAETLEQEQEESTANAQAEVEALKAERDQYLDQAQRALADFANFRRRAEQERVVMREIATRGLLSQLVPIFDELQRGLASMPESDKGSPWAQGILMI